MDTRRSVLFVVVLGGVCALLLVLRARAGNSPHARDRVNTISSQQRRALDVVGHTPWAARWTTSERDATTGDPRGIRGWVTKQGDAVKGAEVRLVATAALSDCGAWTESGDDDDGGNDEGDTDWREDPCHRELHARIETCGAPAIIDAAISDVDGWVALEHVAGANAVEIETAGSLSWWSLPAIGDDEMSFELDSGASFALELEGPQPLRSLPDDTRVALHFPTGHCLELTREPGTDRWHSDDDVPRGDALLYVEGSGLDAESMLVKTLVGQVTEVSLGLLAAVRQDGVDNQEDETGGEDPCVTIEVIDRHGAQVPDALVVRANHDLLTDARGTVCLPGFDLPADAIVTAPVSRGGACADRAEITIPAFDDDDEHQVANDAPLRVVLDIADLPRVDWRSRVVSADGQPLAGAEVEIQTIDIPADDGYCRLYFGPPAAMTALDGTVVFRDLVVGKVTLNVSHHWAGRTTEVVELPHAGEIVLNDP